MPVGTPSAGGPIGRSRMRISASGYVVWKRCPRQWFTGSKIGLRGPVNPRMVMGIRVEEALVGLLMESPMGKHLEGKSRWSAWVRGNSISSIEELLSENSDDDSDGSEGEKTTLQPTPTPQSIEELREWIMAKVDDAVATIHELGSADWKKKPYRTENYAWDDLEHEILRNMLIGGLTLFLEEVEKCHAEAGGPHRELWQKSGDPHRVPAPRWDNKPCFPLPNKVPGFQLLSDKEFDNSLVGFGTSDSISWAEAWEIARPWVKDPRVYQPQRMYHPAGWASGELDLVLRWRGKATLVDIKASDGNSKYAAGLEHQLAFYRFLWAATRQGEDVADCHEVEGLEGWYLNGPQRKIFSPLTEPEMEEVTEELHGIWKRMITADAEPENWPDCTCGGCTTELNKLEKEHILIHGKSVPLPTRYAGLELDEIISRLQARSPAQKLSEIKCRINVMGDVGGRWGPLSNHYGEQVHGAVMRTGGSSNAILEEMGPGAFPPLSAFSEGEHVLCDVAPGQWRKTTRLYLDGRSKMVPLKEWKGDSPEITRLGLIQTRINADGLIVGRGGTTGVRISGKPWAMVTAHLWDGERVIEIVAFGRGISESLSTLQVGDRLLITGAELGFRAGLPQIRVSPFSTRIEVISRDWQSDETHPNQNL